MNEHLKELRCGRTEKTYVVREKTGHRFLVKNFEAGVVGYIRSLPVESKLTLIGVSATDLERAFKKRSDDLSELVIKILSAKWLDRETDTKFILKEVEFERLGYRTFQKLKNQAKSRALSLHELDCIIEYMTIDGGEWYCPKGFL